MSEMEDRNYITGNHMNHYENILEWNICFKYISVSFIKHPGLISSVSAPHIYKLQVQYYFLTKKAIFRCCSPSIP